MLVVAPNFVPGKSSAPPTRPVLIDVAMDASLLNAIAQGTALKKTKTNDRSGVRGAGGVVGKPGEKPAPEKADESSAR